MRPVKKLNVGETYVDKHGRQITIEAKYDPYEKAFPHLKYNLGLYCSYCESTGTYFEIEHVIPKFQIERVEHDTGALTAQDWDNLLLACKHCNSGSGCKRNKIVHLDQILLPHRDNTYAVLDYKEAGVISLKANLSPEIHEKAQALIDLLSLDRNPDATGIERDHRLEKRSTAWSAASGLKEWFEKNPVSEMIPLITINAQATGFFSIWYTVFQDHPEVQQALLQAFPGTNTTYFQ